MLLNVSLYPLIKLKHIILPILIVPKLFNLRAQVLLVKKVSVKPWTKPGIGRNSIRTFKQFYKRTVENESLLVHILRQNKGTDIF